MSQSLNKIMARLTANSRAQKMLRQWADWLHLQMGVGGGAHPDSSGEASVVRLLVGQAGGRTANTHCVFDVGANDGGFIRMLMSSAAAGNVFVHAFEPGQYAFKKLQETAAAYHSVKLNHCGLGSSPGELILHYSEPGSALASLTKRRLDHFRRNLPHPETILTETVKIETLDNYCETEKIDQIEWLKIDVEGHELDVLNGAKSMLTARRIQMVSFEFGGCNIDTRTFFQDYWYFFKQFPNARIFRLTPSGYMLPITKYLESLEQFRASNFLVKM